MAAEAKDARTLSQAALARELGLAPSMIVKLKAQGMPVDSVARAISWRERNLNVAQRKPTAQTKAGRRARPREVSATDRRHDIARTSREESDAELARLRVLEVKGVLVHVAVHRARVARHLSSLRDAFLQVPARLAASLAAETDEAKCHNLVQDEIFSVLARLTEQP